MDSITKLTSDDSAAEKLVQGKGENSSSEQKVEIKYMADSQNGETKIDMDNLRTAFVGMGKEELMKYANDPFWVKMRWFLFILFWVLWFAMLSGAIAIIVLAPKCSPPSPPEWYQESLIYEVDLKSSTDGDDRPDINGLNEKLEHFEALGIKTILVDSLMKSKKDHVDHVEDFMSVDPTLGTVEDLKKLTATLKEKNMHLLMSFSPDYTSDTHSWFQKSIAREEPFSDYYLWSPSKETSSDGQRLPPNNWLSVNGGSAWEWNDVRGEFYLHQFNKSQPDLNFRNRGVADYFKQVFKYWLDMGVSGFYLNQVEYLFEDPELKNEPISRDSSVTHDQYDFYTHKHTTELPETVTLLKDWANDIKNHSGVLSLSWFSNEEIGAQLFRQPLIINSDLTADKLKTMILKRNNATGSSPVWEWVCEGNKVCLDEEVAKSLQMSLLLLPGTTVIKSDAEFVTSNSSAPETTSSLPVMIKARSTPSFMYGSLETRVLNSTVFAYSRIKPGSPGYLVAFNLGEDEATVNFEEFKGVPGDVTIISRSFSVNNTVHLRNKPPSSNVSIPAKATLVLSFVPKKED